MEADGIIDRGPDLALCKMLAKLVPSLRPDDVLMVNVMIRQAGAAPGLIRQRDPFGQAKALEFFAVVVRNPPASRRPIVQMWQLHVQDCGLDLVETKISTNEMVIVTRLHPVLPAVPEPSGECFLPADDHPGIAGRPEIFRGIKAEGAGFAHRAGFRALALERVFGAQGLGCVFNDRKLKTAGDFHNLILVAAQSEEMNGDNGSEGVSFRGPQIAILVRSASSEVT